MRRWVFAISGVLLVAAVAAGAIVWRRRGDGAPAVPDPKAARSAAARADEAGGASGWFGDPQAAPRRIAGQVLLDGAPLEGAVVSLENELTDAGVLKPPEVVTGADGRFDLGLQVVGPHRVTATAAGKAGVMEGVDLRRVDAEPATDALVLALATCQATVFGVVADAARRPIAGARVQAASAVVTRADGAYELCLPPGDATIRASAPGYARREDVVAVQGRVQHDVFLALEAVIVGRVVRTGGGGPIPGAVVQASDGAASTVTSEGGRFRLTGLPGGRIRLRARAAGAASARPLEVLLEAGETAEEVLLPVEPTATVAGRVTVGGAAAAGTVVTLNGAAADRPSAVVRPDGTFAIHGVPRGTHRIDLYPGDARTPTAIQVTPPGLEQVDIVVEPASAIEGQVTYRGAPVGGVAVRARSGNARYPGSRSGPDGRYRLVGLDPGTYVVEAVGPSLLGATRPLAVGHGERLIQVNLLLHKGASISGVVVAPDGTPVAGAAVVATSGSADDRAEARAGEDGRFTLTPLHVGGRYLVAAFAPGTRRLLVPPKGRFARLDTRRMATEGVRLVVQPNDQTISGRVLDAQRKPRADVEIVAAREHDEEPDSPASAVLLWGTDETHARSMSDPAGGFTLDRLAPGRYRVWASPGPAPTKVVPATTGTTDLEIGLEEGGEIKGVLAGFSGTVDVTAARAQNLRRRIAPTRSSATDFTFRHLAAGRYWVEARTDRELAGSWVDVSVGGKDTVRLESSGSGRISGKVRILDGAKLVLRGVQCSARVRTGDQVVGPFGAAPIGEEGRFTLADVPAAGQVSVGCTSAQGGVWLIDSPPVTVKAGGEAAVEVPAVATSAVTGATGIRLDDAQGVLRVKAIAEGLPADETDLEPGDLVLTVDGIDVKSLGQQAATALLGRHAPGEVVRLEIERRGATRTIEIPVAAVTE